MAKIIFITGGQRSGKSSYAQKLALSMCENPIYLATSRIWDDEFAKRIQRHKNDRDERWTTIEEPVNLHKHLFTHKTVVMDCITLWLTNLFFDNQNKVDDTLLLAKEIFANLTSQDFNLIMISNEIGQGGISPNELQRQFTDLQGWMNQHIAALADEVVLMVSGIAVRIK